MRRNRSVLLISLIALAATAGMPGVATAAPPSVGLIPRAAAITRSASELFGDDSRFGIVGDKVNSGTGNLVLTGTDVNTGDLSWDRTFNSLSTRTTGLGTGWTSTYSASLAVQANGDVLLTDDDGRTYTYTSTGGGYTRPLDLDDKLTSAGGQFTLNRSGSEDWTFSGAGRLTAIQREGERLTLAYDGAGHLIGVTSSAGQRLTLAYTGDRISSVTTGDGRVARYTYNGAAMATATAPDGTFTGFTSAGGQITAVTDRTGTTSQTYDGTGRVATQTLGAQTPLAFAYSDAGTRVTQGPSSITLVHDANGHLTSVIDAQGKAVTQTYDARGHLTSVTKRGGATTTLSYDDDGNVLQRNQAGDVWAYLFDTSRRVTQQTAPGDAVTSFSYTGASRVPSLIVDPEGGRTLQNVVDGLVTSRTDPDGDTETYLYNAARQLTSLTDDTGAQTTFAYDPAGRPTTQTSPLGLVTTLVYNAAGRLIQNIGSDGAADTFGYDGQGRITSDTDADGGKSTYTYTADSKVASITDPTGGVITYGYDGQGNLANIGQTGSGTSTYTYDDQGRASILTAADGSVTRYSYDVDGNRTEQTGQRGTEATSYDTHGRVVTTKDELGRETKYSYDAAGHVVALTDPTGAVWRTAYDKAGRIVSTTDPTGAVERQEWSKAGDLTAKVDALGRRTTYTYDKAHNMLTRTDPAGGVTKWTYDKDGRTLSRTTAAGLVTKYTYGKSQQPATMTDPRGGVTTYTRDKRGNTTQVAEPGGGIRRFTFDATGRMLTAQDENAHTTRYAWTKGGQLASTTDAGGRTTSYTYDNAGQQTSSTDPLGRVTKQTYNSDGSLTSVTQPDGGVLKTSYDKAQELISRTGTDGSTISYTYDLAGRRATMADSTGTTRYRYDAAGRLLGTTRPDGAVMTTGWDGASELTGLTYPDGRKIGYTYDPNGRLSGVTDTGDGNVSYTRDADGRVTGEKLPRAWSRTYGYTGGLLTAYTEQQGLLTLHRTALTRNADGLITRRTEGTGLLAKNCDYTYDPAGQLTGASGLACQRIAASYDATGNRTSLTRGALVNTMKYDDASELISSALSLRIGATVDEIAQVPAALATATANGSLLTTTFRYDTSGRQTGSTNSLERTTTHYDGFGRTSSSAEAVGLKARQSTMTYDGSGLVSSVTNKFGVLGLNDSPDAAAYGTPDTTQYLWTTQGSVPQVLAQRKVPLIGGSDQSLFAGDGQLVSNDADFIYGNGRVFAHHSLVSATFSRDVFGSAVQTLDTKLYAQALDYDTLGLAGGVSGLDPAGGLIATQQFGYRGELGVGGDIYLRARTYDPSTGQFTSVDPVSQQLGATSPDTPYAYANNDPNDYADPRGEFALGIGVLAGAGFLASSGDEARCSPGDADSLSRHQKRFGTYEGDTTILCTRGYITDASCIRGDLGCLSTLWHSFQPERAAQAVTLGALDDRRTGDGFSFKNLFGFGAVISKNIDWELGEGIPIATSYFRTDISTDSFPARIYEVKRWNGGSGQAEAETQLLDYEFLLNGVYSIPAARGTELIGWATEFQVVSGFWDFFPDTVYVWSDEAGKVYFDTGDKVNSDIKTKAKREKLEEQQCQVLCIPGIPVPIGVPLGV